MITITTEGGTTFTVQDSKITITRSDQPECTIPEDDLEQFWDEYEDAIADDEAEDDE